VSEGQISIRTIKMKILFLVFVLFELRYLSHAGKAGVAWDNHGNLGELTGPGKLTWVYNWSPDKPGTNVEFVPMLWGPGQAGDFVNKANSGGFSGSSHILGFNEPDNGGQSNLSPEDAARLWKQYMDPMGQKGFRLGAPAVTSAPSGKPWLQRFFQACGGCRVDFIPIHWYGSDGNLFISYVNDIHNTFGKNVWVTEWACAEYGGPRCDQNHVYDFMGQTTQWLDQQPWVERFSWFGCRVNDIPATNALLNGDGNSRTGLGDQYAVHGGHG